MLNKLLMIAFAFGLTSDGFCVQPPFIGHDLGAAGNVTDFLEDSVQLTAFESAHAESGHTRTRLITKFDDGVALATEDDEFELRLRMMQQTDAKFFLPAHQDPARPGLYIPRFRMYLEGHISESYEYELSLQRSIEGVFDVLDASLNFRPSEELQIKFGRFLVPYSYAWYDHLEQYFIAPERALVPLNFGLARQAGLMFHGVLNEGQLQYALGGFSGQRAGVADTNSSRSLVGYLNWRPFLEDRHSVLRYLNVGGSGEYGDQSFPEESLPLRTAVQSSENDEAADAASTVFLEFHDDVRALGPRNTAAIHMALYSGSFSLESEVQYGRAGFRTPAARSNVQMYGYDITASYFLTGEEVTDRSVVIPRNSFDPASGFSGPGAIEPYVRFSHIALDDNVFTAGLADPDDWTRRVSMVDLGWNWYPNRFVKFYFDWQVAMYDSPVLIDPTNDRRAGQTHTLWARAQVFF